MKKTNTSNDRDKYILKLFSSLAYIQASKIYRILYSVIPLYGQTVVISFIRPIKKSIKMTLSDLDSIALLFNLYYPAQREKILWRVLIQSQI